jgi:GMP synthase-like glutamine amidotransferase
VSQGFEEYGPYDQAWWGDGLNPPRRTLLLPRIGEEILAARDPEIRLIFVTAANPACMAANAGKVAQAFRKAEFVVYSGHFLDDTSDLADVFLPATTFLEENDVMASYGHNYLGPVNPAIEPVGECKSEFQMFSELASRFPFAEKFRRSVDDWLTDLCAPVWSQGHDLESLRRAAVRLDAPMVPYADGRFPTPSGKFQFMTEFEPERLITADPDYPYRLLTIAPHGYICSERTMAEHEPWPVVEFSSEEARRLGLAGGSLVAVQSPVGQVRAKLRLREGLRPDVVVAERGGWARAGHGLNALTLDLSSRVGQGTPFYETSVRLSPWPEDGMTGRRVLVVRHSPHSPGGTFLKELQRLGVELADVWPEKGQALPESPEGFDGLVVLGGPQHAYEDGPSPHFPALLELMRACEASGRPVAGICLGAQLLARAWGARVHPLGLLEFGYLGHELTAPGQADPVIGGGPLPELMMFHEDTFDLPESAVLLVRGQACPHQAFRVGRASYAFQFHLEADSATVADWIDEFRSGRMAAESPGREQYDEAFFRALAPRLPLLLADSEAFCRRVAARWAELFPGTRTARP